MGQAKGEGGMMTWREEILGDGQVRLIDPVTLSGLHGE